MIVIALTLVVVVICSFVAGRLWQRHLASRGGHVLFPRDSAEAAEAFAASDPIDGAGTPGRAPMVSTILTAGILLWFSIDAIVWLVRPGLPPSTRSLDGEQQQVTFERGIEALPTLSPDGEWVAYRSDAAGTGDIHVRRIGDGTARNLTGDLESEESDPAFSPDGRQIAFRSTYQNGGIYLVDREGGTVRRVTNFGASPAWTPDGRAIVFATRTSIDPREGPSSGEAYLPSGIRSGGSEGWIVNVESKVVFRLARGDFRQPAVSPDGRRIAYWSGGQPVARDTPRRRDGGIRTVTIDGRQTMNVTTDGAADWSPVWSPDGTFLYFLSDRGGRIGLWRVAMDPTSGGATGSPVAMRLEADRAAALAISRDGRRLAWSTSEWRPTLLRIDYDADTRSTRGVPAAVAGGILPLRCPQPSPDGDTIAGLSDGPQPDVYLVSPDRGAPRAMTTDPAVEGCPRWSPDGTRLAFHSNAGGLNRIWIANGDGSAARIVADSELTHPVWSPDGTSLVAWDASHATMRLLAVSEEDAPGAGEPLPSLPHRFTPVAWSPDGTQIAGTAAGAVWVYLTSRRTYERLIPGSGPAWLSSSRRLIVAIDGRLVLLDVPTRFTREILSMPDTHLDAPFLSRDDRHLYFSRNTVEANIWLATLR